MNERIKQFIKQMDQAGLPSGGGSMTLYDTDLEYFAELIVRDCATKANATALDLQIRPELDARKYVGDGILKLFGVEQ